MTKNFILYRESKPSDRKERLAIEDRVVFNYQTEQPGARDAGEMAIKTMEEYLRTKNLGSSLVMSESSQKTIRSL